MPAQDDRDKLKKRTPPAGVQAQIAPPVPLENWDSQKTPIGAHPTPVEMATIDESPIQTLVRRTGETKNSTIDALREIGNLRADHKNDIIEVHKKIDVVAGHVGDLREKVGTSLGQNEQILLRLDDMREAQKHSQTIKTTTRVAEAEIEKTRQLTDIEIKREQELALIRDTSETRAVKRRLLETAGGKAIAGIATALALLAGGAGIGRCSKESGAVESRGSTDVEAPSPRSAP